MSILVEETAEYEKPAELCWQRRCRDECGSSCDDDADDDSSSSSDVAESSISSTETLDDTSTEEADDLATSSSDVWESTLSSSSSSDDGSSRSCDGYDGGDAPPRRRRTTLTLRFAAADECAGLWLVDGLVTCVTAGSAGARAGAAVGMRLLRIAGELERLPASGGPSGYRSLAAGRATVSVLPAHPPPTPAELFAAARTAGAAQKLAALRAQATVMLLTTAGPTGDVRDSVGRSALHLAAACGHRAAVARLLRAGAVPVRCGGADAEGMTPMHCAAAGGHAGVLEMLPVSWALAADADGNEPLHWAAYSGSEATVLAAVRIPGLGRCLPPRNNEWQTALHCAAMRGAAGAVRALLRLGFSSADVDKEGRTPLHHASAAAVGATTAAAEEGAVATAFALLEAGAEHAGGRGGAAALGALGSVAAGLVRRTAAAEAECAGLRADGVRRERAAAAEGAALREELRFLRLRVDSLFANKVDKPRDVPSPAKIRIASK